MSNSDTENTDRDDSKSTNKKFDIKSLEELKKFDSESLFSYIKNIHGLVKKQEKKIKKYKNKINKLVVSIIDVDFSWINIFWLQIKENCDLSNGRSKKDCVTKGNISTNLELEENSVKCLEKDQEQKEENKRK